MKMSNSAYRSTSARCKLKVQDTMSARSKFTKCDCPDESPPILRTFLSPVGGGARKSPVEIAGPEEVTVHFVIRCTSGLLLPPLDRRAMANQFDSIEPLDPED